MDFDVVTGSFGYIGRYITRRLLASGREVKTITTHPNRKNPHGQAVEAFPFNFDNPKLLVETLRGARTLYNTYWVRFEYGNVTFGRAVENTKKLFECARRAGVSRIVHISVTQASENSPLPYYRGKALQEKALRESGLPYTIIRPTLVFGREDILINNIAWMIRTFPVFPIFGSGQYRVQPIFVDDLAAISVASALEPASRVLDAAGPEDFTFEELVQTISSRLGRRIRLVHLSPSLGILLGKIVGVFVNDIVLTKNELKGLMDGLLCSKAPSNGTTRFSEWLKSNADSVGTAYTSELARHFRWKGAA